METSAERHVTRYEKRKNDPPPALCLYKDRPRPGPIKKDVDRTLVEQAVVAAKARTRGATHRTDHHQGLLLKQTR